MIRLFFLSILISIVVSGCKPAAAPIAVGDKPVVVNGVQGKDVQSRPLKPPTEMSWTGFDGSVKKIKDYQGKVMILDFWATYCLPCIEEIPHLMELESKYGEQLEIIGLNVGGEEDKPKIPEFVERLKITYPLGHPEDALSAYVFGTDTAIPQTAIFDRNGKLVRKIVGFSDKIEAELDAAVESTVNSK
jgi:thiol-disulfide isomerase/thioredoxin